MKEIKILIYLLIFYNAVIAFSSNGINYSEIKERTWEEIKKHYLKPKVNDVTKMIVYEKIELQSKKLSYIFPENEIWVSKKIKKENLYETTLSNHLPDIFINGKLVFPSADALIIGNKKFIGIVFGDLFGNLITTTHNYYLASFDKLNIKLRTLTVIGSDDYRIAFLKKLRLINVKNEIAYIASWNNETGHGVPEYAYVILYKLNILKGEVEIFDSYEYGIITMGIDIVEGYYPFYDISEDKRFVYIPARCDKEYTDTVAFKREKVKMNGGLYVYDWWENRLFKLAEGNVVAVTNNTEDGYVYFRVQEWTKGKRKYEHYRIKNPEEMLINY